MSWLDRSLAHAVTSRAWTLVLVGCMQSNPPPQYAAQQPPLGAPPPASAPVTAEPTTDAREPAPAAPQPPAEEPLRVDPAQEMPAQGLSTSATLSLGTEDKVLVDARSDIYSSGAKTASTDRRGVLPAALALAAGGGIVTFPKVVGKTGCAGAALFAADGGDCAGGSTDLQSAGGISGIVARDRSLFLVGVFLGDKPPKKAPPRLDFSAKAKGTTFAKLEPALGQVFFIGDGSPGDPQGGTHDFVIPKGATTLHLGFADGFAFQGPPGAYGDNRGGLEVTVLQRK